MRISLVQTSLHWENPAANLENFTQLIAPLAGQTDLIILPEMFTTGFTMNVASLSETMESRTLNWMRTQTAALSAAMTGSIIVEEDGFHYNRLIWVYPDGSFHTYDKRHLFSYAGENKYFKQGSERTLIDWQEALICPFICYDLRFPVWSRNYDKYDLAIYVANWPERRSDAWRTLLKARAIENQCFCVGVNVVGSDGNEIVYSGNSSVFSYDGTELLHVASQKGVFTIDLDFSELGKFRSRFNFLEDRDRFEILV